MKVGEIFGLFLKRLVLLNICKIDSIREHCIVAVLEVSLLFGSSVIVIKVCEKGYIKNLVTNRKTQPTKLWKYFSHHSKHGVQQSWPI